MSAREARADTDLLDSLNRDSWRRSFSPALDVDWSETTTPDEYRALYDAWSLLGGTRHEQALDDAGRARFARYQQMNLMLVTALVERHALSNLDALLGESEEPELLEYVAHLIKEETYHYVLFSRAIARILEDDPGLEPLPRRHIDAFLGLSMTLIRWCPFRRVRHALFFRFLRFAEVVTLQAHRFARRAVPRRESLVPRVWALHALDEARHVAFDDLMLRRARLPGPWAGLVERLTFIPCAVASLLLNLNEIWAARRLGVRVGYHELPALVRGTSAPFKRGVFELLLGPTGEPKERIR